MNSLFVALAAVAGGAGMQYRPSGFPAPAIGGRALTAVVTEFALDVAGGRDKVYLQPRVDPANTNLLWAVRPVGREVMFVSRVDGMALDASGGVGNPYPRSADPGNPNHRWLLAKVGDEYMIWSAVAPAVLDANGGRGRPYLSRQPDPRNVNHLWTLRPVGDHVMLIPKVRGTVTVESLAR